MVAGGRAICCCGEEAVFSAIRLMERLFVFFGGDSGKVGLVTSGSPPNRFSGFIRLVNASLPSWKTPRIVFCVAPRRLLDITLDLKLGSAIRIGSSCALMFLSS